MLTKLLFTGLILAIAYVVVRHRASSTRAAAQPLRINHPPVGPTQRQSRVFVYAVGAIMLLGTGFAVYQYWHQEYRVLSIRLINTQTGETVSYQARKNKIDDRRFETLDGRIVTVAGNERVEILPAD